jgi:hypothetical protein
MSYVLLNTGDLETNTRILTAPYIYHSTALTSNRNKPQNDGQTYESHIVLVLQVNELHVLFFFFLNANQLRICFFLSSFSHAADRGAQLYF